VIIHPETEQKNYVATKFTNPKTSQKSAGSSKIFQQDAKKIKNRKKTAKRPLLLVRIRFLNKINCSNDHCTFKITTREVRLIQHRQYLEFLLLIILKNVAMIHLWP